MTNEDVSELHARFTRRRLLQGSAALAAGSALAAFLPESVRAAIAQNAPAQPFDVSQVKHLVFLMQENRSYDHYFGTLAGTRGFSDPDAIKLPTGRSVFYQPDPDNPDGYLLPYHLDATNTSAQAVPSLSHAWQHQHAAWNHGLMDNWVTTHIAADTTKNGPFTMGYYEEADIPFQFALANAFTICDNYHCSVMGPTWPNRLYWWSGTIDPEGAAGGPILDNNAPASGYGWPTMGEVLQEAGVSWKVYQPLNSATTAQSSGPSALNVPTSGFNMLLHFANIYNADPTVPFGLFQNACFGSTLFGSTNGNGLAGQDSSITNPYTGQPFDYTTSFEEDCYNGTLPAVSWIATYGSVTEHPAALPAAGADYVASKIAALAANPDLWNSTVFVLDYDENDGFFDHVPPITPPAGTADEFVTKESPGGTAGSGYPVGSGFRVPCIVISPWTVGGYVCSQPFDHTSTLQLIEQVFLDGQPANPNVSAWRRETFGDLTAVFQPGTGVATSPADPSNPADTNFTHATNAANLATQTANEKLPLPAFPRTSQPVPTQQPGTRPTIG